MSDYHKTLCVNASPPTVLGGILLKLCRCFCQVLKMCKMFGCNPQFGCSPQINFCHFFRSLDLVIFGLTILRYWVSCERNSSYSITQIFLKLCRCLCQGLKMCMKFGYNPQINFCHFFRSSDFINSHFWT